MRCADVELESDRFATACRGYLLAAQYYWLALFEIGLGGPERRRLKHAHVGAFRTALPLLPHATTPFALDVDAIVVAGYLFMPVGRASAPFTVLWPAGAGATAESSYWQVAVPLLDTGSACAAFATTPRRSGDGPCSPATELIGGAVAHWVRQQPGVDRVIDAATTTPVPTGRAEIDRGRP